MEDEGGRIPPLIVPLDTLLPLLPTPHILWVTPPKRLIEEYPAHHDTGQIDS